MLAFESIEYLRKGTKRQRQAYQELTDLDIMTNLKDFQPILAGTIPIRIDVLNSDLDIICRCTDHTVFSKIIKTYYQTQQQFKIETKLVNGVKSTIANFKGKEFEIEIFAQDKLPKQQNAYRHMLMEYYLLKHYGEDFRKEIIYLKSGGMKTEQAFAHVLKLSGNPYEALLDIDFNVFVSKNKDI